MSPKHALALLLALPLSLRVAACRDFDGDEQAYAGGGAGGLGGTPTDHLGGTPMDDAGGVPPTGVGADASSSGQGGVMPTAVDGEGSGSGQSGGIGLFGGGGGATNGGSGDGGAAGGAGAGNAGEAGASPDLSELAPSEVSNLVWWLEASRERCTNDLGETPDGDFRVAQCVDASGHDNTAKSTNVMRQPLFVAHGPSSKPTLKFDGEPSVMTVADSETLRFGFDAFTLLLVGRWNNAIDLQSENDVFTYAGYAELLSKVTSAFPFDGFALFANYPGVFTGRAATPRFVAQLEYGTSLFMSYSTNLNDNKLRLYVVNRPRAGVGQIRINGRDDGSAQIAAELDVSAQGQPLTIGGWVGTPFRGELSEVLAIAGTIEQSTLERLERHLLHKYALSPAESN